MCLQGIVQSSIEIAIESTEKGSRNLIFMFRGDDGNNEISPENYKSGVKNSVPVAAVTIDGGCQKRYGFNSLLRVAFIISVDTGEVLDSEVKCKHCSECRVRHKWDKNSDKCKAVKVNKNICSINHEKSAGKYRKRSQRLRQRRKTKPADKENYLSLYKISVKHLV